MGAAQEDQRLVENEGSAIVRDLERLTRLVTANAKATNDRFEAIEDAAETDRLATDRRFERYERSVDRIIDAQTKHSDIVLKAIEELGELKGVPKRMDTLEGRMSTLEQGIASARNEDRAEHTAMAARIESIEDVLEAQQNRVKGRMDIIGPVLSLAREHRMVLAGILAGAYAVGANLPALLAPRPVAPAPLTPQQPVATQAPLSEDFVLMRGTTE